MMSFQSVPLFIFVLSQVLIFRSRATYVKWVARILWKHLLWTVIGGVTVRFHRPSSKLESGSSEGAGEGGGGTKLERGTPWVKESRHIESKYLAARVLELLALGLRVCASWSRVLLKGVLRIQVAPIPEGRRKVLMIFCGLASGDSLFLRVDQRCVSHISFYSTVSMLTWAKCCCARGFCLK